MKLSKTNLLILVGFIIRLINAIYNAFVTTSFGADADATGFHETASELSKKLIFPDFAVGEVAYTNSLGLLYRITGPSLFIGGLFSCFAWFISALVLLKLLKKLDSGKKNQLSALLFYCFLPSSIFYTSISLREPFQLLFIITSIYFTVNIFLNKSLLNWIYLFLSLLLLGTLHGSLSFISLFYFIILITFLFINSKRKFLFFIFCIPLLLFIVYFLFGFVKNLVYSTQFENGLTNAVELYQTGGLTANARAQYRNEISLSSNFDLLFSIPYFIIQYLFEPFPWHVTSVLDIILLYENILRLYLILSFLKSYKQANIKFKNIILFIFFIYLINEITWSLGTINWGTASRHHIPTFGLLLILGYSKNECNILKSKFSK